VFRDDDAPTCPRCKSALDDLGKSRLACGHGGRDGEGCGVLVREDALIEAIVDGTQTTPDEFSLDFKADDDPGVVIDCPRCGVPMKHHLLYEMHVDRCADHGVWFDGDELGKVLAGGKPAAPEPGDRLRLAVGAAAGLGMIALHIVRFIWF
jgi:uncharacterized C2H2 Zn-finger protein